MEPSTGNEQGTNMTSILKGTDTKEECTEPEITNGNSLGKVSKKSVEFSILWRPPPPGGYSMEFIYDFFPVPVSQIRVVCVATLGDLNTGY